MTQPNILFIFSDQQRWDTLGCYGQRLDVTPNLDRLAAEGVRFENAFTCQPVCGPARACLHTGRYATETGCVTNGIALPEHERTIAHGLRDVGYDVAYVGKWHLGSNGPEYHQCGTPPERRGGYDGYWVAAEVPEFTSNSTGGRLFDRDLNPVTFGKYRVDAFTDFALAFLDQWDGGRPFFLFLSYVEPHPQSYRKTHYHGPTPQDPDSMLREYLRYEGPPEERERFADCETPGDLVDTQRDWDASYRDYLASCARIDANVGRLLSRLADMGLAEDTLVFYTSDHACHFHTRNESDGKASCHEDSIRIPLIVSGPSFSGGNPLSELVSLIDLPSTLLRAADAPVPATMRGRPLQDLTSGRAQDWRQEVLVQIVHRQPERALRTHRWKYCVGPPDETARGEAASDVYVERYLYDLDADPHERRNLVDAPELADVRAELRGRLRRRIVQAGEPAPEILQAHC